MIACAWKDKNNRCLERRCTTLSLRLFNDTNDQVADNRCDAELSLSDKGGGHIGLWTQGFPGFSNFPTWNSYLGGVSGDIEGHEAIKSDFRGITECAISMCSSNHCCSVVSCSNWTIGAIMTNTVNGKWCRSVSMWNKVCVALSLSRWSMNICLFCISTDQKRWFRPV